MPLCFSRLGGRVAGALLLCSLWLGAQTPVRIATWNVQSLGSQGSGQWNDAVATLARLGADVVCLQEVDSSELGILAAFAAQAGYPHHVVSGTSGTLSGSLHNAVLSLHPITGAISHTAASLSGDPQANDITRDMFEARVQVPGAVDVLGLFVVHLKAGSGATNDFRRAVEDIRLNQAIAGFTQAHPGAPHVVLGDFNDDLADGPFGNMFTSLPGGLPGSYSLGNDITFPVVYQPFGTFTGQGAAIADATQEDSTTLHVTRAASGRRLDYLLLTGPVTNNGDEVYNSLRDNGVDDPPVGNWLFKFGMPPPGSLSASASDHFPVFGDFTLTTGGGQPPVTSFIPGDIVVSEYMNNPAAVSDSNGEWLELLNTTAGTVDLLGFTVRDQGSDSFTLPTLLVPARGRVVLARNGNPAQNGGVVADFTWPSGSFLLGNAFDEIEVVDPSGQVLDSVVYDDGATFPDPTGSSVERRDVTALPWAQNFGVSTTVFGQGDTGTPGQLNSLSVQPLFTTLQVAGPLTAGSTAFLSIDATSALGGQPYVLVAAECTAPGIVLPVSGRVVDACQGLLFQLSISPGNPFFVGFSGTLNPSGQGLAILAIPSVPGLTGLSLQFTGVVLGAAWLEGVASVIDNLSVTLN